MSEWVVATRTRRAHERNVEEARTQLTGRGPHGATAGEDCWRPARVASRPGSRGKYAARCRAISVQSPVEIRASS